MSSRLIVSDAIRQIVGRAISAMLGIAVVMMISQYVGPYRFGDYTNILDIFAIRGALADFGLYTLTLRILGPLKESGNQQELQTQYSKFLFTRVVSIVVVYATVLIIAYQIPAYTANPYLVRGLPIGALFSAIFMASSMIQLPLQLFWQMRKVTIALTIARVAQLAVLVGLLRWIAPGQGGADMPVWIFVTIIGSVLVSGIAQLIYTYYQTSKHLRVTLIPDRQFTRDITRRNAAYGLAYFLSSMHTLAIAVIIGLVYPTISANPEQGIRKLPLGIIVVLIIIPSSLGNSMIHKIADYSTAMKRAAIGHLITLMIWIGGLIIAACIAFAPQIIGLIGGVDFLSTSNRIGSDMLLPRLAVILVGSFVKQCFNYLFLSIDRQNTLLTINGVGILVGLPLAIFAIYQRGLIGALRGQGILELLFIIGSLRAAYRYDALPTFSRSSLRHLIRAIPLVVLGGYLIMHYRPEHHRGWSIALGAILAGIYTIISLPLLRRTLKGLG